MEYAAYAIKTVNGQYAEADTIPDLLTGDIGASHFLMREAILERLDCFIAAVYSDGDAKGYLFDAAESFAIMNLGEPENRLMKTVEFPTFTLYGIPEGPMPGETQLCLQCKWRGTDACKTIHIINIDDIRKLECPHFEPVNQTGFYLNYENEDERIYLGVYPEEVAEKLELDYEDEAIEACKEWVDYYYAHDELVEMIANCDTPSDPVNEMVRRMFEHFNENAHSMSTQHDQIITYGTLSFVLMEDRMGVELTSPRTVLYHKYRVACEKNETPVEEVLTYNDLVFSEGLWLHPELINEFASKCSYEGWLNSYNKLQPEIAEAIRRQ